MKLALFFTTSISLRKWEKQGVLEREIKLYNALSQDLEMVYFLTYGGIEELHYQNLLAKNIKILPNKWNIPGKIYSFLAPFFYYRELQEVDAYKTNQMSGAWSAVIAKFLFKKKLIVRCGYEILGLLRSKKRKYFKKFIYLIVEKIVYKSADLIILTSKTIKKFVIQNFDFTKNKIQIIPNYIGTNLFKKNNSVIKEKNSLIYVGRLHREKNLLSLIKAVEGLDLKVIFIGDGPLRNELELQAKKNGVNLEFKGLIPNNELPNELNKAEIFILPSFQEGSPKSLLEAMACGLCCVGANVDGINEIIRDGFNGYLSSTDSASIRQVLQNILSNRSFISDVSENAIKTVEKDYSLDKVISSEKRLYSRLLN